MSTEPPLLQTVCPLPVAAALTVGDVIWYVAGALLGLGLFFVLVFWFGRSRWKKMINRISWDRRIPNPFPKDMVIATYHRRKRNHKHHRHHYRKARQ